MNAAENIVYKAESHWGWQLSYVLSGPQEITEDLATPFSAHKHLLLHLGISQIFFHRLTSFHLISGSLANCPRISLVPSCSQKAN